jgi:hypothetical protein
MVVRGFSKGSFVDGEGREKRLRSGKLRLCHAAALIGCGETPIAFVPSQMANAVMVTHGSELLEFSI